MPLGVDLFFMHPGIKLGLIIELVPTSTALLVVNIFSTIQQVAVTITYPSSLLTQFLPSGPPHNSTIEGVLPGKAGASRTLLCPHGLSPF